MAAMVTRGATCLALALVACGGDARLGTDTVIATGQDAHEIAVSPTSAFWIDGPYTSGDYAYYALALPNAGSGDQPVPVDAAQDIAAIAAGSDDTLYVVARGSDGRLVADAVLPGTRAVVTIAELDGTGSGGLLSSLAVGSDALYYEDTRGVAWRVPTAGGPAVALGSGDLESPASGALAVDGTSVWVSSSTGAQRFDLATPGQPAATVALGQPATALALDGDSLFLATGGFGTPGIDSGEIARVARDGTGSPAQLTTDLTTTMVAANGTLYYVASDTSVGGRIYTWSLAESGGDPAALVPSDTFAVDDEALYWTPDYSEIHETALRP